MKNLRKILLSLFFGILINTSVQSITLAHGVLSAFSIFTNVMADEHTAEKAVIKELKIKIYNLDSEPVKRKLVQSDKKYITSLKEQLNELIKAQQEKDKKSAELKAKEEKKNAEKQKKDAKENKRQALKKEIEDEITALGFEPVTQKKEKEFADDEEIQALEKQLSEIKALKAKEEKETAEKQKKDAKENKRQALKKEIEDQIIALGVEPVTKKSEFADDEEIQALQSQLEEVKKAKIKALKDKYDELKKAKAEKEKEERLKALKEEIESEIIALGAKPVTQNSEFADDANIQALGKQLEQLRIEAESKKAAEKLEGERQEVIQIVRKEILELGETPISEYVVNNEDEFIKALNSQLEEIKKIKAQEEKEIQESIPEWFIMMPKANEKVIYVRGTAVVDTLQGSIDSATNAALRELGKKLETRLNTKVNETVIQAGIGEDIKTKSEMERVSTLVVKEVTISGYEIAKTKMFKMDNGKYRSFILLEYPVGNLYKAFINRLENSKEIKESLIAIKNTDTFKELEAYVVDFAGA